MPDDLSALRSQLRDQRQRLRELNRRCRVVQFQAFNYAAMEKTRRALSEQLMAERNMHELEQHEREEHAAARIDKLQQEIAALDDAVRESATMPPAPITTEAEIDGARDRADQLAEAIAAVRSELEAEIVREQRAVHAILSRLEVEQEALDVAQAECAELEAALSRVPPPLPNRSGGGR